MRLSVPDLRGRLVLVTGAGSGIGRASAIVLAAEGARLVICDRDGGSLEDTRARLGSACVMSAVVDVTDRDAMRSLAERVHGAFGSLDVLINNAGVAHAGRMIDTSLEDWDFVMGVNLGGVIHGCHFFVPAMVKRGRGGHVVNVASMVGLFPLPGIIAYVSSKFAVVGLSEALRAELAPHGIGVSVICPGVTRTGISRAMRLSDALAGHRAQLDRFGGSVGHDPESVAHAIVDAIRANRGTVPVSAESRALHWLRRRAPRAAGWLSEAIARVSPGEVA